MLSDRKIHPIVKMPVEAQATEALRRYIIDGVIGPGERITEVRLSANMGLSRTTVRTALHQLAKEGLITQVPYTGWTVMALTAHDIWELYTLRAGLEGLAAKLAAERLSASDRNVLENAFARLVSACGTGDRLGVADADFALHEAIINLAGHSRLGSMYLLIGQQIRLYIRSSDALIPNAAEIIAQHRPIVDAILAGNAEAARALSERHNITEGERLMAFVKASAAAHLANPAADS